jgi:hypothetical protein
MSKSIQSLEEKWQYLTGKPFYSRTGTKNQKQPTTEPGDEYSPTNDILAAITNLPSNVGSDVKVVLLSKMIEIDSLQSETKRKDAENILLDYIRELHALHEKKGGKTKYRKNKRTMKKKTKKNKSKRTR